MTQVRLSLGRQGEDAAVQYLQRKGMKILERNLRTPVVEIDLIARDRNILAFVVEKTQRGSAFGSPDEAVGLHKQRQIIRTAKWSLDDSLHVKLQPPSMSLPSRYMVTICRSNTFPAHLSCKAIP